MVVPGHGTAVIPWCVVAVSVAACGLEYSPAPPSVDADAAAPLCDGFPVVPDEDGDGVGAAWTAENSIHVCSGEPVPAGYVRRFPGVDCDDSDPTISMLAYRDADGDQAVVQEDTVCYSGEPPPGYLPRDRSIGGDCDDTDPNRHARALEQWDDGTDQDCDGLADPVSKDCVWECGCELWHAPAVEIDAACPLADLYFADALDCGHCDTSAFYFRVGNRGSVRAAGVLRIESRTNRGLEFELDLAPGAASGPLTAYGDYELAISMAGVDECDLENNAIQTTFGGCLIP